jgi:hypothetical protein
MHHLPEERGRDRALTGSIRLDNPFGRPILDGAAVLRLVAVLFDAPALFAMADGFATREGSVTGTPGTSRPSSSCTARSTAGAISSRAGALAVEIGAARRRAADERERRLVGTRVRPTLVFFPFRTTGIRSLAKAIGSFAATGPPVRASM